MTRTTWSRPTLLKEFSRARQPWISWALIMAVRTSRMVSSGVAVAGEPVGDGEDGAEVVGGVAPLGGEPGVVEVEPADDGADVEGGLDGVELVAGAGDAGAVVHGEAGDERAEELGAGGEVEGLRGRSRGCRGGSSGRSRRLAALVIS